MKRLAILFALVLMLAMGLSGLAATGASAQTSDDDRGYLQAWLEENLSDAGREVRIKGFEGALSAQAKLAELTIADDKGVWLTFRDVVLDWNRSALLKGRLEVTRLSAAEILIPRPPLQSPNALPDAEARVFSLPQLPVAIDIGRISAAKVVLGAPLLGQEATLSLEGRVNLSEGAGQASLSVERIDEVQGTLRFSGGFSNQTRALDLSLTLTEGANGIVADLIGLPGHPAVDLSLEGSGSLDEFTADIALMTDGEQRLDGQIALASRSPKAKPSDQNSYSFALDLRGDIAPLFLPEYQEFFGPDVRLSLEGQRLEDGRVRIDDLNLLTRAMSLNGQMALSADHWPEQFALSGRIAPPDDDTEVLLPLSGPETYVGEMALSLNFDAALGDEWAARARVINWRQQGAAIAQTQLDGTGTLVRGDGGSTGRVGGEFIFDMLGIAPRDSAWARALGSALKGGFRFDWTEDKPLLVPMMTLSGEDFNLSGVGTLHGLRDRLNVQAEGRAALISGDISRFSGLAGTLLSGGVWLGIEGQAAILGGGFDVRVNGYTSGLGIGQPKIDPLLAGDSTLELFAGRDENGTRVDGFEITTPQVHAQAEAMLKTGASTIGVRARLADMALIVPGLQGAGTISGSGRQSGADWAIDMTATGPAGTVAEARGNVILDRAKLGRISGQAKARVANLAPYSQIIGRSLSGGAEMTTGGWLDVSDGTFAVTFDATGQDLGIGQPAADLLLAGQSDLAATLHRAEDQVVVIDSLEITTPAARVSANGAPNGGADGLRFAGEVHDLGIFTSSALPGPARAEGSAILLGQDWQVAVTGSGPGGMTVDVSGQIAANGGKGALVIKGRAPLTLVNRLIAPNLLSGVAVYDLVLNGPFVATSLAGTIRTDAARLVLPTVRLSLDQINATARLSDGNAVLNATSAATSGGRLHLSGPVSLAPPYEADLALQIEDLGLTDARLYETTVDGTATLKGPLLQGSRIAARLVLGPTEIRVPDGSATAIPVLSDLKHINEPRAVRDTRARAGMLDSGKKGRSNRLAAYPIDILVLAPSRLFVRGRGLDAELGGQIHLRGTSLDVIPQGQFDLIRGRLDLLGKRLTLSEGYALLQGDFDPYIRLVAETRSADTDIRIIVEGPVSAPEVIFESNPELPQDEVLSHLLFGRDLSKISPLQALQLVAAVNTLAGRGGGGIVSNLRKNFGLDDLDITTAEDGTTTARIGKYITEKLYTDVTIGADGTSEINLNLSVSPSVTARGKVGSDGNSGLGVFYEKDY